MKLIEYSIYLLTVFACSGTSENRTAVSFSYSADSLVNLLEEVWMTEQEPIRVRDSLGEIYGYQSEEFQKQNTLYHRNHDINEKIITDLLNTQGWPSIDDIGARGALTICNVLQHSNLEVRLRYLPMMKEAVRNKQLQPRLLARAEDRIATDRGELQIYGGQIKYYPETQSFNVWPIMDPVNVDKRRLAIGLDSIASFLASRRNPIEWNLDEQIKRTEEFEK